MEIVLVYIGERVPNYVFLNLVLLQKTFPHTQVVFLSDYAKNVEAAEKLGASTMLVPSPEKSWKVKPRNFNLDTNFRSGFWYKTFARFHSLAYYAKTKPLDPFLHVESDVLLLPNFPIRKFALINEPLAFPLSATESAAASTLFVKNYLGFLEFLNFAELEVYKNPTATDMSVLASFANCYPEKVLILPTALDTELSFTHGTPAIDHYRFHSNLDLFEGIFDANTWGQFLTGQDERNFYGIRKVYHTILNHAVEPKKFRFSYDGKLHVSLDNRKSSLYSLHIHSKDKRFFGEKSTEAAVQSAVTHSDRGPTYKINLRCFIIQLPNTLKKISTKIFSRA
jgi:hypothetical protein